MLTMAWWTALDAVRLEGQSERDDENIILGYSAFLFVFLIVVYFFSAANLFF